LIACDLESLLGGFAGAGIETMPLKGPVLAEALYGDVAARHSVDLDLLVRRQDLSAAQAVLAQSGFSAEPFAMPISGPAYDLPFRGENTLIELHTSLGRPELCPLNSDAVWSRSACAAFRDRPIRTMSEEDLILYLCYHLLRHECERLQWLADVGRALQLLAGKDSGESLLRTAQEQGFDRLLLFAAALASETLQTPLPAAVSGALRTQPKIARKAQEFLQHILAASPDQRPAHATWSFYSTERSAWRRWGRRLRELAPTDADRQWAQCCHIPALLVTPLLPLLRAIRILRNYGVAAAWRNFMQGTR
jgi:hypothetical protein